jgi:mRNA-degrading endonuclease RelE of RelBE toxin-antitoxin system
MNWIVRLHENAAKQLNAIPPDRRRRIISDLTAMEADPFSGLVKPLKGKELKGKYRKVSGRYRIIFKVSHAEQAVEVLAILLRNESTYR